jgi:hypothetical protein
MPGHTATSSRLAGQHQASGRSFEAAVPEALRRGGLHRDLLPVAGGPLESGPGGFWPQEERAVILAGVLGGVELGAWDRRVARCLRSWIPRRW